MKFMNNDSLRERAKKRLRKESEIHKDHFLVAVFYSKNIEGYGTCSTEICVNLVSAANEIDRYTTIAKEHNADSEVFIYTKDDNCEDSEWKEFMNLKLD